MRYEEIDWELIKDFVQKEFDDPDYPGSGKFIDPIIVFKLQALRTLTSWKIITHRSKGGCVDIAGNHGHAERSYHRRDMGSSAVDFHFETNASTRMQYSMVESCGFTGIGVYYDWGVPIGFHVDDRPVDRYQRWTRVNDKYIYLLK